MRRQHRRNRGRHPVSVASRRPACRCRTRAGRRRTSRMQSSIARRPCVETSKNVFGSSAERTSMPRRARRSSWNGPPPASIANTTRSDGQRSPAESRARRGTPPASARDSRSPSPTTPVESSLRACGRRPGARRRASALDCGGVEHRRRAVEVGQHRRAERHADEAVAWHARREREQPAARRGDERARPVDPRLLERGSLVLRQSLEPEARLQRDDRDVDRVAVERPQPPCEIVIGERDLEPTFSRGQLLAVEERRRRPARGARRRSPPARGADGCRRSSRRRRLGPDPGGELLEGQRHLLG